MQTTAAVRKDGAGSKPIHRRSFTTALAVMTGLVLGAVTCGFSDTANAQAARLVKKSGEWSLYAHGSAQDICFLTSAAKQTEPKGANRKSYFYISAWPKEGVKSEISVNVGTELKAESDVVAAIGSARFKLFARDDKAFVTDAADELKLIEAIKKGSFMTIQATPSSGAAIKDTFSLIGVSAGLTGLAGGCK